MKSFVRGLAVVAALVVCGPPPARAENLTMSVSNDIRTQTCADAAACARVSLTRDLGTLGVRVGGTASGSPVMGPFEMDVSHNVTALSIALGRAYTIRMSGVNPSRATVLGSTPNDGATTAYALFADTNNARFGTGTSRCRIAAISATPFADTCSSGSVGDSSFSLTQRIAIAVGAARTIASGDALDRAPERGTLLLVGSAMAGLGALRRRWKRDAS